MLPVAGPLLIIGTALLWVVLLVFGWALLLWPHLPGGFLIASGLDAPAQDGFLDAVYVSLVTIGTLGYGEITPRVDWLRILVPLEATVGFAVLTAVISWVLLLYGALRRRRALAREMAVYLEAPRRAEVALSDIGGAALERVLARLTNGLVTVREDLVMFPESFYFQSPEGRSSLARFLPSLVALTDEVERGASSPALRMENAALRIALDELAAFLDGEFLHAGRRPTKEVFRAYAEEHQRAGAGQIEVPSAE